MTCSSQAWAPIEIHHKNKGRATSIDTPNLEVGKGTVGSLAEVGASNDNATPNMMPKPKASPKRPTPCGALFRANAAKVPRQAPSPTTPTASGEKNNAVNVGAQFFQSTWNGESLT